MSPLPEPKKNDTAKMSDQNMTQKNTKKGDALERDSDGAIPTTPDIEYDADIESEEGNAAGECLDIRSHAKYQEKLAWLVYKYREAEERVSEKS